MCSASSVHAWHGALLSIALAIGALGCNQSSAVPDVLEARPLFDVPVGPIPGPEEDQLEGPPNPFAENRDSLGEGRRFFVDYNCAGCHGDHGGGGMGPSLRDDVWLYGSSDAHIANSIAEGRAFGMPSWRSKLTDAQMWQIAAYLKSMRTEREPQAPLP